MTEREKFILRAALLYAQSNLDDLNEAFDYDENQDIKLKGKRPLSVNGDIGEALDETEVAELLLTLQ